MSAAASSAGPTVTPSARGMAASMVTPPRVVIAAPASGHGKTAVATGLMAALRNRGLDVSGHKVGPDYIDPSYHALATGRPGRNLDPVLCGEDTVVPLFRHGARGADVAVIEGVMGLYDGRGTTPYGSTAHVARLLGAPVILVVDAAAQGRSLAALVSGFTTYDPTVRIGGVVLNRVGSDRHEEILRSALDELPVHVPVLGVLRRADDVVIPSRHLGLVPAAERTGAARAGVRRLAALVAGGVDLDAVLALAASAAPLPGAVWTPGEAMDAGLQRSGDSGLQRSDGTGLRSDHTESRRSGGTARRWAGGRHSAPGPVVAVAGGPAFSFSYAETVELLAAAGADIAYVDPLRDEALPAGTAGLVIGGGFPEVHAGELAQNRRLRAAIARFAASGAPVIAECAGLLYLARELDGRPMCGVLDVTARMTERLTLGYREAVAGVDSVVAEAGTAVPAHEFHRTSVEPAAADPPAWRMGTRAEGFVRGNVHASYLHLHWAGRPEIARRFVAAARRGVAA